ncbi:MAG: phosphate ABC transporter permease [Blastocatellia bacterium AA13]|nr:MAG: phosphate ABC transporter permease [Blastocatellia bacterium AA13]
MKVTATDPTETETSGSCNRDGAPAHTQELPENPVVVIEASRRLIPLHLPDLWAYRELLYFLMWRDIKVRYKQTVLGALWAILQPLVTMIIFAYFFGILAKLPTEGIPYPVFFYTGLTLWTFFSNAVISGANSLVGNSNLITKVYFPRLIIPSAAIGAGLVDFGIASLLLVGLLAYYHFPVTWSYLLLAPLLVLTTMFSLGIGIWLSALNVRYRDVRYALPFLIQIWMFVSPIIYPSSLVPHEWRWMMILNPLTGIIEGYRACLFNHPLQWPALGYSTAVTILIFLFACYWFRKMERNFAEFI